jgi:hypothetical protein
MRRERQHDAPFACASCDRRERALPTAPAYGRRGRGVGADAGFTGTRSLERGQPSSCRSSGATTRGGDDDEIWRATLGRGVVGAEGTEEAAAALDARMGRRGKGAQQGT